MFAQVIHDTRTGGARVGAGSTGSPHSPSARTAPSQSHEHLFSAVKAGLPTTLQQTGAYEAAHIHSMGFGQGPVRITLPLPHFEHSHSFAAVFCTPDAPRQHTGVKIFGHAQGRGTQAALPFSSMHSVPTGQSIAAQPAGRVEPGAT
jgi:hypothetical protein